MQSPFASHVYPAGQVHGGATWQIPPPPEAAAQTAGVPARVQSAQDAPAAPQVCASVPETHVPFAQQPAHVVGPQGGAAASSVTRVVSPAKSVERPHPASARKAHAKASHSVRVPITTVTAA
jgi:hypothetical protein